MNSATTPTPRPARTSPDVSRPCLACPIELVALTRIPRAEALATIAAGWGQRVCAATAGRRYPGLRGLLAVLALCAWQSAAGQSLATPAPRPETITIHGVVIDDSLNVPLPGMWLFLSDTKYGAITDTQGAFTFSFPTAWKPVRGGILTIKTLTAPWTFKIMCRQLDWRTYDPTQPLVFRLASAPGRGRPNLHGVIWIAPPVPPPVYPSRSHIGRP